MKFLRYLLLTAVALILIIIFPEKVMAQKKEHVLDFQNRSLLHVQYESTPNSFVAGWIIANPQLYGNNNVNGLLGIGFRGQKWWFETMIQRQWGQKGDKVLANNRFNYDFGGKASLYLEVAPFLNERDSGSVYDMIVFEKRVWRKLSLGIETENVHKKERDSLGLGPRVRIPLDSTGNFKTSLALAYQLRSGETDTFRFYLIFSKQFQQ